MGSDVEGWVPNLDGVWGQLDALDLRQFFLGPLFDNYLGAVLQVEIDGGYRTHRKHRNVEVVGEDGHIESPDLICNIPVPGHAVCAHQYNVDRLRLHQEPDHRISDKRRGELVFHRLKGSQSDSLVIGPCFRNIEVFQLPSFVELPHDSERCPPSCSESRMSA